MHICMSSQQKNLVYALWQEVPKLVYTFWTCKPVIQPQASFSIRSNLHNYVFYIDTGFEISQAERMGKLASLLTHYGQL